MRAFLILTCIACVAWLAGCASSPIADDSEAISASPDGALNPEERALAEMLAQAQSAVTPEAERHLLQAGGMLRDLGRREEALALLSTVDANPLPLSLAADVLLLRAQLHASVGQPGAALAILYAERLRSLPQLSDSRRVAIRLLRAELHADAGQHLESAQERIQVNRLLPRNAIAANHEQIWIALKALDADLLRQLSQGERSFELQGWYELGLVGTTYQYNLDRQLLEFERWRETWARHPAALILPQELQLLESVARERPAALALLLPLNTNPGAIIRDAFMGAYYHLQEIGGQVPSVRLYDTSDTGDILNEYNRAVSDGADMIIGPLLKQHVARLRALPELAVPVLALNSAEDELPPSERLFQFALSPESEGVQIANRAWRDGHRYAAILRPLDRPNDDFYSRKRNAFIAQWQSLGGLIVAHEVYLDDYTETVASLLNLGESQYRRDRLSELLGESLAFTQRRRRDIDFIFLIADPVAARQINPTLAYLYAGDIPVYASQDVYSGLPKPLDDQDLNGIQFGESPWLLNQNDELRGQLQTLFPQSTALNLRLQAFGVDAFRLHPRLQQLSLAPGAQIYGATGLLKLEGDGTITRQLHWARVENGLATPLAPAP